MGRVRKILVALLVALGALLLGGCATSREEGGPRPLKAREILHLVSLDDALPLPVVTGVEVRDVGQFTERLALLGPPEDAPLCPGRRFVLDSHSRLVRAELLRGFGFTFVLRGEPQAGEAMGSKAVPLTLRVEHPPLLDPVTGEIVREELLHIMGCIGHESDAVFLFESDWERVSGPWSLTLLAGGKELAGKRFDIVGARDPETVLAHAPRKPREPEPEDLRVLLPGREAPPTVEVAKAARPVTRRSAPSVQTRETRPASGGKRIYVLVSSNIYKENAEYDVLELRDKGYSARLGLYKDRKTGRTWHTARLGSYATLREAEQAAREFTAREGRKAYVVVRRGAPEESVAPAPVSTPPPSTPSSATHDSGVAAPAVVAGGFAVQVAACLERRYAEQDARQLQARGWPASVLERTGQGGKLWHTVVLGRYPGRGAASLAAKEFTKKEGRPAFAVSVPRQGVE